MALAKIIAGPILRRVESKSVSVWICCSENLHLTLKLYEGDNVKVSGSPGNFSTTSALEVTTASAEATTIQFGKHMWIAVVTAIPQVALQSSKVYSYNVHFQSQDSPALKGDLKTEGFLSSEKFMGRAQEPLGYGDDKLPSFVLSNEDPQKLFVAQASCRKMHGHGHDAIASIDKLIKEHLHEVDQRPQQLFLTGDQIYADDVPGPLLRYIGVVDGLALGVDEKVKVNRPDGTEAEREVSISVWPPYLRQRLMNNVAGFTSGAARNHVISFTEFAALYLAYWNIRCWNIDLVSEVAKIQADNKDSVALEVATSLLDSTAIEDDPNLKGIYEAAHDNGGIDFEMALGDQKSTFVPESSSAEDVEAQQQKFDTWIETIRIRLKSELKELAAFASALPKVSRVLANVPCYMIFDDHEITDDWYLTKAWKNQVLSKHLGRDVIRNGLMAYAVFQDWGNVPDEYIPIPQTGENASALTPRTRLLRKISDYSHALITTPDSASLRTTVIADIETLLGLGDAASEVKWHYQVPTGPTTTFVLDTRTRREYDSLNSPPGLLTKEALEEQIPAVNPAGAVPFAFVVSAAPAPGLASFEELVQPAAAAISGLSRPSGPNPPVFEGMVDTDFEAWGFNVKAVEALIERMAEHKKVIVFCGDVHYGFSSVLDYWKEDQTAPEARILTFTSSAAKNESSGVLHLYRSALIQKLLTGIGDHLEKLGWKNRVLSVTGPASIKNRQRLRQARAVIPVAGWQAGSTINRAPDYRWRLRILTDEGPRTGDPVTIDLNLSDPVSTKEGYENAVARHHHNFVTGIHRRMVWPANVGLLRFEGEGDSLTVKHEFLFVPGSRDHAATTPGTHIAHSARLVATGAERNRPELP